MNNNTEMPRFVPGCILQWECPEEATVSSRFLTMLETNTPQPGVETILLTGAATCPTSLPSKLGAAVALPHFIPSRSPGPARPAAAQPARLPAPGADAARPRVPMATGVPSRHAGGCKPRPAGRPCARARCVAARQEGRSVRRRRRRGPESEADGGGSGGGSAWRPSRLSLACRHVRAQQTGHRRHLQAAPLRAHQQGEGAGTRRGRGRAPPL